MNKNKKRLSRLLVPLLALSGVNMDAMETVKSMRSWKLPLSSNIPHDGENKFENPDAQKKWHNAEALMTIDKLENWLNGKRSEIFYAIHQGDTKRSIANFKIGIKQNSILNAFKKWHDYTKQKSKSNIKWNNVNWSIKPAEEMKELVDKYTEKGYKNDAKGQFLKQRFVNNLSFPAKDGYKKNWAKLGRGPLHESGKSSDLYVLQSELKRVEKGDVNCTIWASLINWFLNENGYPAQMYHRPGHEFVVAPVTDKNKKGLYLCYIGVNEHKDSLDDAEITVGYLCRKELTNKVWLGTQPVYRNKLIKTTDPYSPTLQQYCEITEGSNSFNTKQLTAITKGIQKDFEYWHKKGEIKTDTTKKRKTRTYPLKILPRYDCNISVPLNLEYLDRAIDGENGKKIYTKKQGSPGSKNETNLIYINLFIGNLIDRGKKIEEILESTLSISVDPTVEMNINLNTEKKQNKTYYCKWKLIDKDGKEINLDVSKIMGLDTNINEAVAFWNDPNYKDPVTTEKK